MAVVQVPLDAVASQSVAVTLGTQPCVIVLRQLGARQYISVSWNGTVLCSNVLVVNLSAIIRAEYTGFVGDLAAIDLQGDEAPQYDGWGTRWLLLFNPDTSA
jgi:hypothetical protein